MADSSREAQARRLKAARVHAGYRTAKAGWEAVIRATRADVSRDAYYQHENGIRSLAQQAQLYADTYSVPAGWLVWGDSPPAWARSTDAGRS